MKLLVAGGRNLYLSKKGFELLDKLHAEQKFTELVNGMATGVDDAAREWAERHGIPLRKFPARWKDLDVPGAVIKTNAFGKYNAKAGLDRNQLMLQHILKDHDGLIVIFPGNSGSKHMLDISLWVDTNVLNLMNRTDLVEELQHRG